MPELPEVETVKEKLKPRLINKCIRDVHVYWPNTIVDISIDEFKNRLINQSFFDIKRRGKWLIFELNNDYLLVHLRMEGKFFFKNKDDIRSKHEHIVFTLDDQELRFHDTRKFGKMYILSKDELNTKRPLNELGLEPFDELLTVKYLKDKLRKKSLPIKEVLLDQRIIVGIGNIYADEILFLAGINPYAKACGIKDYKLCMIIDETRKVLRRAIELGGTTIRSYVSLDNEKGSFQDELFVHKREGLPCKICHNKIIKVKIGGRGTYYCPICQK